MTFFHDSDRRGIALFLSVLIPLVFASCGKEPDGKYVGEISDWESEVFQARSLRIEGQDYFLQLALRQVGKEMPAELLFRHQKTNKEKLRTGTWSMGDGKRVIAFPDGKEVQEYYLYKKGSRFVLEDRWGLVDDNGSMFVLIRNKGKSRKRSFPIDFTFESDGEARFTSQAMPKGVSGEWQMIGKRVAASFLDEGTGERQKYFLFWKGENLAIEKLTMYLPFFQKYYVRLPDEAKPSGPFSAKELREGFDGGRFGERHEASHDNQTWIPINKVKGFEPGTRQLKRKNWMYHTVFDDPPILKPR